MIETYTVQSELRGTAPHAAGWQEWWGCRGEEGQGLEDGKEKEIKKNAP